MIRQRMDTDNKFVSRFNTKTGEYYRSSVLGLPKVDPFMSSMPELIDIGIMGHCENNTTCLEAGIQCYQGGRACAQPHMKLEDYMSIIDQVKDDVYQCLREDEVVICRGKGILKIKDIEVGDYIYNGEKYIKVINRFKSRREGIRIKLSAGMVIDCTSEHKFPTNNGLKFVKDLKKGDILKIKSNFNLDKLKELDLVQLIINEELDNKFFINGIENICKQNNIKMTPNKTVRLDKVKAFLSLEDYKNSELNIERSQYHFDAIWPISDELLMLLGYYIGNGSKRNYTMGNKHFKMIDNLLVCLDKIFDNFPKRIDKFENKTVIEFSSTIPHMIFDKLFACRTKNGEKQLPNFLLKLENTQKESFLRGYFCDGTLEIKKSDGLYGSLIFNTSSNKLYKDISLLLLSMDVYFSILSESANKSYYKKEDRWINHKRRFKIRISNKFELQKLLKVTTEHNDHNEFQEAIKIHNNMSRYNNKIGEVVSIQKLDKSLNVVDINVDSEDKLFMTSNGIITHNCALGGHGNPNKHPDFEEFVQYARKYNIVPNYTTSGKDLTDEEIAITKKYCGAVAVSEHRNDYTRDAIERFIKAEVTTNIHYVLGKNTIDEAIKRLSTNDWDEGINAVIFLLHKPVGLGLSKNVLQPDDIKKFLALVDEHTGEYKIGFDSCTIPAILNYSKNINPISIDTCEGGRFSCYITPDMKMTPCSFDQDLKYAINLRTHSIQGAWNSVAFENFRTKLSDSCPMCEDQESCMGGCPLIREVVLCERGERDYN